MDIEKLAVKMLDVSQARVADVWHLLATIFSETDFMSQEFSERFPHEKALVDEIAEAHVFLVAESAQGLEGYARVERQTPRKLRHTGYITMGVREAARGCEVGRALLTAVIGRLRDLDEVEILYLMVRGDHDVAIRLYESVGFVRQALLKDDTKFGGRYFDGVLMSLRLRGLNHG